MATPRTHKSEVHETTDDASSSPASSARTPQRQSTRRSGNRAARGAPGAPDRDIKGDIGGGPGAGDASSGGGAGAGIPGGGTDMRMGGQIRPGDVQRDRERLFPGGASDREDESDFGGPLDLDDPNATR